MGMEAVSAEHLTSCAASKPRRPTTSSIPADERLCCPLVGNATDHVRHLFSPLFYIEVANSLDPQCSPPQGQEDNLEEGGEQGHKDQLPYVTCSMECPNSPQRHLLLLSSLVHAATL